MVITLYMLTENMHATEVYTYIPLQSNYVNIVHGGNTN